MFRSFYLAGFECATGYNVHGEWIDQIAATEHDLHCDADYARLEEIGIHAVREAIRWPLVDRGGRYDFSSVEPFIKAALRHDFDVIWDLFHYGYPDDLDPFSAKFTERFAKYCAAAARYVRDRLQRTCYFTPINEPSYFAWAAGEVGRFAPHAQRRGFELKVALARAALAGIDAIRASCPQARIVNIDPICRVVTANEEHAAVEHARKFNEQWVFEFWDIVSGRLMPELGGRPEDLDIVGVNYYWTNQWELGREGVPLRDDDPRRVSLAELIRAVWRRYHAPIVITETSALGEARAPWLHELSQIAEQLLDEGVPLQGVCLYPILSMPEWHAPDQWARMGLWDLEREQDVLERKACAPMLQALQDAQLRQAQQIQMPPRVFSLPRTGDVPLRVFGRLVWQSRSNDGAEHRLRLLSSDPPRGLWTAAIDVRCSGVLVQHVTTAAELPLLLDELQHLTPCEIAELHGAPARHLTERAASAWDEDVRALAACAADLQRSPPFESPQVIIRPPVFGGRC